MLLQYKICTSAFSLMSKLVHCKGGRKEGRGGEAGIWEQGGTVLCLLPSAHAEATLNSNEIRHRCALLAQASVVHNVGEGLVTLC